MVVAVYFAYLAMMALASPVPPLRRARVIAICTSMVICSIFAGMPHVMPLIYLLVGYWLPASLVTAPDLRVERRLMQFDHAWFGDDGLARFVQTAPRFVVEYLEGAYLLCYAVPAAGYAWMLASGLEPHTDRFWTIVLMASFACYGLLPWLPSRAPRAVEIDKQTVRLKADTTVSRSAMSRSIVRRANLAVLGRASVQWNTFPSGHAAASFATALAIAPYSLAVALVFGWIALSIAIGSVVGRYHYAADAIAGAIVAVIAFAITAIALPAP